MSQHMLDSNQFLTESGTIEIEDNEEEVINSHVLNLNH